MKKETVNRITELMEFFNNYVKEKYRKEEILPILLKIQEEMVKLTYSDSHADYANLRLWDVEKHFEQLNEKCNHIVDKELEQFKAISKTVCEMIRTEISGNHGEAKASKALDTLQVKNYILKNVELQSDDHRTEIDDIVVTPYTISIIEVKNTSKDILIDDKGNYYRLGKYKIFDNNIGEKMNEKEYLLKCALDPLNLEQIRISKFVVFTNSRINVQNDYEYVGHCFLSQLPHIIDELDYFEDEIYSDETICRIVEQIKLVECKEAYPLPFDLNQFITDFATLMAMLEEASISQAEREVEHEEIKCIEITGNKKKFDFSVQSILNAGVIISGLALAGLGIAEGYKKYHSR